jgi:hypothetical protein
VKELKYFWEHRSKLSKHKSGKEARQAKYEDTKAVEWNSKRKLAVLQRKIKRKMVVTNKNIESEKYCTMKQQEVYNTRKTKEYKPVVNQKKQESNYE